MSESFLSNSIYQKYIESEKVKADPYHYNYEYFETALKHGFTAYPDTHNKLRFFTKKTRETPEEKTERIRVTLISEVNIKKDNKITGTADYILKPGQHLSSLNLPVDQDVIWDIDTNSGKTYYIVNEPSKKVVVFPTQDLTLQTGREYGKHVVWEGHEANEDHVQLGTYNAISKFSKLADKHERTLVIDEGHNLALAASFGYKKELMNQLLDEASEFKNLILLSGTWIPTLHPQLAKIKHTVVRREVPHKKLFEFIVYKDRVGALQQKITRGKLNIVFLQSKDLAKTYGQYFENEGIKTRLFNADTKHLTDHREIVRFNEVDPSVEILFVTSLFNEGLNIYNLNIGYP